MKKMLLKFADNLLSREQMRGVKGGYVCVCKQAAPYACSAAGNNTGTVGWNTCVNNIYADCASVDPACK